MKITRDMLSTNFRRDYVAWTAIALFLLIFVMEFVLAFAIPAYLNHENAVASQVRRLRFLYEFDSTRHQAANLKPKSKIAQMEVKLLAWTLDDMSDYLRVEAKNLTDEEITEMHASVREIMRILGDIRRGKSYSIEKELKTEFYINRLIKEERAKMKEMDKKAQNPPKKAASEVKK